jgi:O-antigen/teichoic acid export membrane protein
MIVPPAALVVNNMITAWIAGRAAGISWSWLMSAMPSRLRHPGASIRAMSGPMLIITLGTPIALQSDRIILSHVSTAKAVAEYSVIFQIIAPMIALVAATAQPLWPIYTNARSQGRPGPSLLKVLAMFCAGAIVFGVVLTAVARPVGHLIGGTHIQLGFGLATAGALTVLTAAVSYPVAMSLMDSDGVRFVGLMTVVAVPLNIALSIWLANVLDAPGPLLGSCIVGILIQSIPALVYRHNRRPPGRHRHGEDTPHVDAATMAGAQQVVAVD